MRQLLTEAKIVDLLQEKLKYWRAATDQKLWPMFYLTEEQMTAILDHIDTQQTYISELDGLLASASDHCNTTANERIGLLCRVSVLEQQQDRLLQALKHIVGCDNIVDAIALAKQPEPVNQQLLAALKRLLECYKMADHHDGYCCCGSPMDRHVDPMNCGHCATDAGEYSADLVIKEMEAAIAATEAAQPVVQYASHGCTFTAHGCTFTDRAEIGVRVGCQQLAETCATCGAHEPFTGTCGASDSDTKALCKQMHHSKPASSQTVAVPDEMKIIGMHPTEYSLGYEYGWNACRAAMLSASQKGGAA